MVAVVCRMYFGKNAADINNICLKNSLQKSLLKSTHPIKAPCVSWFFSRRIKHLGQYPFQRVRLEDVAYPLGAASSPVRAVRTPRRSAKAGVNAKVMASSNAPLVFGAINDGILLKRPFCRLPSSPWAFPKRGLL